MNRLNSKALMPRNIAMEKVGTVTVWSVSLLVGCSVFNELLRKRRSHRFTSEVLEMDADKLEDWDDVLDNYHTKWRLWTNF